MKLSRIPRAGAIVGVGPSGVPPTGLRAFETAQGAAPVLVRPEGSILHYRSGFQEAYFRGMAAWHKFSDLGQLMGYLYQLLGLASEYAAGARAPVIIHDAAFSGASVTINGLSSAKRYRLRIQTDGNGVNEPVYVQPNGSSADCQSYWLGIGYTEADAYLTANYIAGGTAVKVATATIEPRTNGRSLFWSVSMATLAYSMYLSTGATLTDFTSLVVVVSATSRTGWLTVEEETP